MTKKRILLIINIVVILAMAITIVAQCVNVFKIKKEQQLYFDSELNTVSHQIKEYKLTGHKFLLEKTKKTNSHYSAQLTKIQLLNVKT